VVSSTPWPHFTPGKDPLPIFQEAGWAPGPVRTGGKSRPHRDSIPDRPARSQSLYRLSYHLYKDSQRLTTSKIKLFSTLKLTSSFQDCNQLPGKELAGWWGPDGPKLRLVLRTACHFEGYSCPLRRLHSVR